MSVKSAVSGETNITPVLNLSECLKTAQNDAHSNASSTFPATITSASRYRTGARGKGGGGYGVTYSEYFVVRRGGVKVSRM